MADTISGITTLNGTPTQARVTVIDTGDNSVAATALSDSGDGTFSFAGLGTGTYELLVMADGKKPTVDGPWALEEELVVSGSFGNTTTGSPMADSLTITGGVPPYTLLAGWAAPSGSVLEVSGSTVIDSGEADTVDTGQTYSGVVQDSEGATAAFSGSVDVAAVAVTYQSMTIDEGPECYLPLNESSGTTASDLSGNGRHGTYGSAVTLGSDALVSGETDTSVLFNAASNNYVQIPDASWMDQDVYSIEFLVKPTSTAAFRSAFSRYVNTTNRTNLFRVSGSLQASCYANSTTVMDGGAFGSPGGSFVVDQINHVVVAVNNSTGYGEVWVNGVRVDSETGTSATLAAITADMYLGCRNGSSEFWGGKMAHFAYFSHTLSQSYIESKAAKAGLFTP